MALRIEGQPAERTRRTPGHEQGFGAAHEVPGLRRVEPYAKEVRTVRRIVRQLDVLAILGRSLRLDDDRVAAGVPGERHRADPKQLHDGLLELAAVANLSVDRGVDHIEQVPEPFGQGGDLRLLEPDADDRSALAGLEIEGPVSRLPDRAGHEAIGIIEDEEATCHLAHRSESTPLACAVHMGTRPRSMAEPRQRGPRIDLSPRARRIGGWLAAIVVVLLIAAAVRVFGGNADGSSVLPGSSASAAASPQQIVFGTALDADRHVPATAQTDRFVPEDLFAYSVPAAAPASTVYVAVSRTAGGPLEVVQAAVDAQAIPDAPATIGFRVPAANLFDAFGPGTYEMRISIEAEGPVIAVGAFELVAVSSASPSP